MSLERFLDDERKKYNLLGMIMGISKNKNIKIVSSGTSMTTVPVSKNMHYRIGGQGITILTTLFLILVDEGKLSLSDKVSKYLPKVQNGDNITLKMLCNMTANLPDYILLPEIKDNKDVFKQWKHEEILQIIYNLKPFDFQAGTRFNFAHVTNIFILCTIMELATKTTIKYLLETKIFGPLNLKNTYYEETQVTKHPTLHVFTNERIETYEDSTYWNASWGWYDTVIISNTKDVNRIAFAIGSGSLISKNLYNEQMSPPSDISLTNPYYGLGVGVGGFGLDMLKSKTYPYTIIWSNQNFGGYIGMWAYIPKFGVTISLITNTFNNDGFKIETVLSDFIASPIFLKFLMQL